MQGHGGIEGLSPGGHIAIRRAPGHRKAQLIAKTAPPEVTLQVLEDHRRYRPSQARREGFCKSARSCQPQQQLGQEAVLKGFSWSHSELKKAQPSRLPPAVPKSPTEGPLLFNIGTHRVHVQCHCGSETTVPRLQTLTTNLDAQAHSRFSRFQRSKCLQQSMHTVK
ncbi:hypothetical protein WJX73_007805, partial [Symbiochloris irregularis]